METDIIALLRADKHPVGAKAAIAELSVLNPKLALACKELRARFEPVFRLDVVRFENVVKEALKRNIEDGWCHSKEHLDNALERLMAEYKADDERKAAAKKLATI